MWKLDFPKLKNSARTEQPLKGQLEMKRETRDLAFMHSMKSQATRLASKGCILYPGNCTCQSLLKFSGRGRAASVLSREDTGDILGVPVLGIYECRPILPWGPFPSPLFFFVIQMSPSFFLISLGFFLPPNLAYRRDTVTTPNARSIDETRRTTIMRPRAITARVRRECKIRDLEALTGFGDFWGVGTVKEIGVLF